MTRAVVCEVGRDRPPALPFENAHVDVFADAHRLEVSEREHNYVTQWMTQWMTHLAMSERRG